MTVVPFFHRNKEIKLSYADVYVARDRCINLQNIIFLGVLLNACAVFSARGEGEVCATRKVRGTRANAAVYRI